MLRNIVLLALCAVVGACAGGAGGPGGEGGPVPAASGPQAPPNYREIVAVEVKKTFFDPYSIRDASISKPIPGTSFLGAVETVCIRANGKNRMGAYIGLKETSYVFRGGQLRVGDSDYAAISCASATYEPFPEIDSAATQPAPATPVRRR